MRRGRHQIGFGIAKNVLQVHGVDAQGRCGVQRQLKRPQGIPYFSQLPHCPIGMEACAGAHFRARKLTALGRIRRFAVAQYSRVRSSDAATKCAFRPAKSTNTPTCVKETSPHETLRSLLPV
jgi:transposase